MDHILLVILKGRFSLILHLHLIVLHIRCRYRFNVYCILNYTVYKLYRKFNQWLKLRQNRFLIFLHFVIILDFSAR